MGGYQKMEVDFMKVLRVLLKGNNKIITTKFTHEVNDILGTTTFYLHDGEKIIISNNMYEILSIENVKIDL